MTQIVLISDQPILTTGFEIVLRRNGFDVIGTSCPLESEGQPVIRLSSDTLPNIILLDITGGLTFGTLSTVHLQFQNRPVVLWSDQLPLDLVFKTLEFGVRGIIPRTSTPEQMVEALRKVSSGELQIGFGNAREAQQQMKRTATLTPREREIVALLRCGLRNKQIAGEMGITEGTVKIYLFRLFHKLNVRNRFELARCGILEQLKFTPSSDLLNAPESLEDSSTASAQ